MKVLCLILLLAVAVLASLLVREKNKSADLSREITNLRKSTNSAAKRIDLDTQQKCSIQSQIEFSKEGFTRSATSDFTNHFNSQLGHCFLFTSDMKVDKRTGAITDSETLSDAFEGKVYGTYLWFNPGNKKFWEVTPSQCQVTLPSGEQQNCKSSEQFDTLTEYYMKG